MKRFQRILVVPVTDGPEPPAALREAFALAAASGAEVKILGHVPDPPACERRLDGEEHHVLRKAVSAAVEDRLSEWVESLGAPAVPVEIATGSLPREVVRRVREDGHDLVVVAADESGESKAAAHRILRTCPCPGWMLRPRFSGAQILAAIDPDHGPDRNRLILELARSQADLHGGELRVMHAWDLPLPTPFDPARSPLDREQLAAVTASVERAHRSALEAAVRSAEVDAPDVHLVDGTTARAVRALVSRYRVDLVVIGAGAWDNPELGLGTTSEQVLAEAESSVLVVRPAPLTP